MVVPLFFISEKDQDIERLKGGRCYEREKQRAQGKQEGAAVEPQREKKVEEGEEEQVGWAVSSGKKLAQPLVGCQSSLAHR